MAESSSKQLPVVEKSPSGALEGEEEKKDEEEKEVEKPMVVENDYLEKAEMSPPQDPEGNNCLIPDLIIT